MKNKSLIVATAILLTMCKKEDAPPLPPPASPIVDQSAYWGCWRQYQSNPNYHDLLLSENPNGKHWYQLGKNCTPLSGTQKTAIGVFRNDTLIFNSGAVEEWAFVKADTLYYGAYINNTKPINKYIKR